MLMIATAPVQLAVAVLVWRRLGRPVLFSQERPGLHGETFRLHKFRTMLPIDPSLGHVTNEERAHPFGQFLRSTSLDELPSLWNVLIGEMSFVGPRPLRVHYLPRYSRRHFRRHEMRPGLTGLAQTSGRNALSWNDRLDLDVQYIEQASLALDLRILYRTFRTVTRRTGIQEPGQASMSEFFGSGASLTTRPLTEDDLPDRVAWLNHPAVREGISINFAATLDGTRAWFKRIEGDATRHDFVCVDSSGALVSMYGFVNFRPGQSDLYLYVNPELHGAGYGRLTMVQLLKTASRLGIGKLSLETKSSNTTAISLYERFGFTKTGITDSGKVLMARSELATN